MNKYRNRKTEIDNVVFDSAKEAYRYKELKILASVGKIFDLTLQPKLRIEINGIKICDYIADFAYREQKDENSNRIYEDVKSDITKNLPVYRLKKRLVFACYGIQILET